MSDTLRIAQDPQLLALPARRRAGQQAQRVEGRVQTIHIRSLTQPAVFFFFFSSRRRHTRCSRDWSSDVCSSDLDWCCFGLEDISRVRNLSLDGLFVETAKSRSMGSTVKLEFLVQEGQIRADAVVKRTEPGSGLALKFTAVTEEDRPRLGALINRFRYSS